MISVVTGDVGGATVCAVDDESVGVVYLEMC